MPRVRLLEMVLPEIVLAVQFMLMKTPFPPLLLISLSVISFPSAAVKRKTPCRVLLEKVFPVAVFKLLPSVISSPCAALLLELLPVMVLELELDSMKMPVLPGEVEEMELLLKLLLLELFSCIPRPLSVKVLPSILLCQTRF